MFLSRHPNWQRSPDPADSLEACGEKRMYCYQPKLAVLGAVLSPWGKKHPFCEPSPGQFSSAQKKTDRELSVQWIGGPKPLVASGHPQNTVSTVPRVLHGTSMLGNQGPMAALKTGFLSRDSRVSTLLPPLTFSTDVTSSK